MTDLKNTPWHTVLIHWDRNLHKVVDAEGFTIVEETDEPTAKAIAALPDTLQRLEKLEKAAQSVSEAWGEGWILVEPLLAPAIQTLKTVLEK